MARSGAKAARVTGGGLRKGASSPRCSPTSTGTCWTESGTVTGSMSTLAPVWCAPVTTLSSCVPKEWNGPRPSFSGCSDDWVSRLHEAKTQVVDARRQSFDFLGFELRLRRSWQSGKSYPHVQPSRKSRRRIGDKLTWLTRRERTPMPMETLVEEVNASLRGWVEYFHYRNCSRVLAAVKVHAEKRLRIQRRRRYGVKSWGAAFAK